MSPPATSACGVEAGVADHEVEWFPPCEVVGSFCVVGRQDQGRCALAAYMLGCTTRPSEEKLTSEAA